MLKTYKIISLLLDYPSQEMMDALPQVKEEVAKEGLLSAALRQELDRFLRASASLSLQAWQMLYVEQFDCSKTVNLYLFDHLYGNSRERGQAMVDLKEMYLRSGLSIISGELPDYLPLFLEYLSIGVSKEKASELLQAVRPILQKIERILRENDNFYVYLFTILVSLSEDISEGESEGISEEIPEKIPERMSKRMSKKTSEKNPKGISEETPRESSLFISSRKPSFNDKKYEQLPE